jgi:hypothetical protein
MNAISSLRELLRVVPEHLRRLSDDSVRHRPSPSGWSPKEELGHLLDSAANNHQRIVRAQLEDKPALPGYEQNRWVAIHGYQHREWAELIEVWQVLNRQLLVAAEAAPDSAWSRTLTVADSGPLALQFVFEDYIRHMVHHLEHIGIAADEIRSKPSTAA